MEVKQRVNKQKFLKIMRQLTEQLENDQEVSLTIDGQACTLPPGTLDNATLDIDYDSDERKTELEITIEVRK